MTNEDVLSVINSDPRQKLILVDFSNLFSRFAYAMVDSIVENKEEGWGRVYMGIMQTMFNFRRQIDNSRIIICFDKKNNDKYWKHLVYPYYKYGRDQRPESLIPKEEFNQYRIKMTEALKSSGFCGCVSIAGIEADDIIGVASQSIKDAICIIYGGDKDFKQCLLSPDTFIYDTYKNVFTDREGIDLWIFEHIVKGDSGDGIFNIYTNAKEKIETGARQKAISSKSLNEMFYNRRDIGEDKFLASLDPSVRDRYIENQKIIDFRFIPDNIQKVIMEHLNYQRNIKADRDKFNTFCIQLGITSMITEIGVL